MDSVVSVHDKLVSHLSQRIHLGKDEDTATINELIKQLNLHHPRSSFEEITFRSLKELFAFLQNSVDLSVTDGNQRLPIDTLRTIELLFLANENSRRHVFNLLRPPADRPTMEFSTGTTISRDKEAAELINLLIDTLSSDVDTSKRLRLSQLLGNEKHKTTAEKICLVAERTNDEVARTLNLATSSDYDLARAYHKLSDLQDAIEIRPNKEQTCPTSEAMFVYLETLAFRHFVMHHRQHLHSTAIKDTSAADIEHLQQICVAIALKSELRVTPFDTWLTASNIHQLGSDFREEIVSAVRSATGIDGRVDLNAERTQWLLACYISRTWGTDEPNAPLLSICDVISAFCSFHYEQKAGTAYQPYWHGQSTQGSDARRHFDKGRNTDDPHQHQGVIQIYLNRFFEYQAAFKGNILSHHAWMRYQVARLNTYLRAVRTNDISALIDNLRRIDDLSINQAKEITGELSSSL